MSEVKKKKRSFGILTIVGVILIGCSGGILFNNYMTTQRQKAEQARLESIAAAQTETAPVIEIESETEPEKPPYVSPINFEKLQEENPDTVAWITVPDTHIDYPVLWKGKEADPTNDYYLHRDFDGNHSVYGSIYLDMDSEPDMSGKNNILYGHHMKDGTMFRDVEKFKDETFFNEHRYFDIFTPEKQIHVKTLACYYGSGNDGTMRMTQFLPEHDKETHKVLKTADEVYKDWLNEKLGNCKFAEVPEVDIPRVYILITCSYEASNSRTFLIGAEVDENDAFVTE